MPLAMTPSGDHSFILGPVKTEAPINSRRKSIPTVSAMALAPDRIGMRLQA